MKTLTFSLFSLSAITEDIYLKLRKGTHTSRGSNPPIFLTKLCPFFYLEFSTFSNISVITEDIYLKLRVVVYYQKGNPYQQGR